MKKLQFALLVTIFTFMSAGTVFAQEADSGIVSDDQPVISQQDTVEPTDEERKSKRLFRAQLLGLSRSEVQDKKASGMSFEEIFEEQGITQDDLEAAKQDYKLHRKINHTQSRLAEAVEKGDMTQEEADRKWGKIAERLKGKFGVTELPQISVNL